MISEVVVPITGRAPRQASVSRPVSKEILQLWSEASQKRNETLNLTMLGEKFRHQYKVYTLHIVSKADFKISLLYINGMLIRNLTAESA